MAREGKEEDGGEGGRVTGRYLKFILCLMGVDTVSGLRKLADYCGAPYRCC